MLNQTFHPFFLSVQSVSANFKQQIVKCLKITRQKYPIESIFNKTREDRSCFIHMEKNNHSISQTAILNLQKVISYFVQEAEGCSKITIVTPEM